MQGGKPLHKDQELRRGMSEALQHVGRGWFPANLAVLKMVQGRTRDGSYRGRMGQFFTDLKKDHSLFTFCLKQLGTVLDGPVKHRSPTEILASLETDKLEDILASAQRLLGVHSIDPTQKAQIMRIRHSVVSSSAAEVLAEKTKLDPDQAFLLSSVKQLGLNLIAWNYPRIYSKAILSASKGEGILEELLLKTLGYSPLELGVRASLDWCHHPDTRAVLQTEEHVGERVSQQAEKLKEFCEIGEILARVHDPEVFPDAVARWDKTAMAIEKYLGPSGLQLVQTRADQQGAAYLSLAPGGLKIELSPERAVRAAVTSLNQRMYEKNGYASKCPTFFAEQFRSVYQNLKPGQPSPTAIKELVDTVIPNLGFVRGCIYLVDQKKLQAIPMLRIGDAQIDRYRALSCGDSGRAAHPVIEALSYNAPIVQEQAYLNGDQVSHVTGVFGTKEKLGVLYLEMSQGLRASDRQQVLLFFKAVREALNDCLNMRPDESR